MGLREWVQTEADGLVESLAKAAARGSIEFLTSLAYSSAMTVPGAALGVFAEGKAVTVSLVGFEANFTTLVWWQFAFLIWLIATVYDFYKNERTDINCD